MERGPDTAQTYLCSLFINRLRVEFWKLYAFFFIVVSLLLASLRIDWGLSQAYAEYDYLIILRPLLSLGKYLVPARLLIMINFLKHKVGCLRMVILFCHTQSEAMLLSKLLEWRYILSGLAKIAAGVCLDTYAVCLYRWNGAVIWSRTKYLVSWQCVWDWCLTCTRLIAARQVYLPGSNVQSRMLWPK